MAARAGKALMALPVLRGNHLYSDSKSISNDNDNDSSNIYIYI